MWAALSTDKIKFKFPVATFLRDITIGRGKVIISEFTTYNNIVIKLSLYINYIRIN